MKNKQLFILGLNKLIDLKVSVSFDRSSSHFLSIDAFVPELRFFARCHPIYSFFRLKWRNALMISKHRETVETISDTAQFTRL